LNAGIYLQLFKNEFVIVQEILDIGAMIVSGWKTVIVQTILFFNEPPTETIEVEASL